MKLAEHDVSFHDIEDLDLADEPLEIESAHTTPQQYPPAPGVLSIEGKPGCIRISKMVPQFSYASGSQPNLSLIGHFDHDDRSSPDFPLPAAVLGNEHLFEYDVKQGSNVLLPMLCNERRELQPAAYTAPQVTECFENNAFDFNAFEAFENVSHAHASSSKKRAACPSPLEPEAKFRRVNVNDEAPKVVEEKESGIVPEEVLPEVEAKRPLPDWVAEFDQDLVAFFGDSVEYKE